MASTNPTLTSAPQIAILESTGDTKFDRRLGELLHHATEIFCEKGYEGASMRGLSRASGMSLAGLYHYFDSKEMLLFLIQKHAFSTILSNLRERMSETKETPARIRLFILNHVEYFLAHKMAMKVLSHEEDALKGDYALEIAKIKREYYRLCTGLLEDYKREAGLDFNSRIAVLSLFGMINWIYTWHNPRIDADAQVLAEQMGDIFLGGLGASSGSSQRTLQRTTKKAKKI